MRIHYSLASTVVLAPSRATLLQTMRGAGVDQIWLHGYFFGHMASSLSQMIEAKELLETYGFEVGVINIPVGHPGNSANSDDSTLDFSLPPHWRYRIDRAGNPVYYCADIEDAMIGDSIAAMHQMKNAGFKRFMMDDDLRQGNWGSAIEGCYCDYCIAEFNEIGARNETREGLSRRLDSGEVTDELKEWVAYQCSKVTRYLSAMALPDIELGTMDMADGDERHGLDLVAIRKAVPDCSFRVGELQFDDESFGNPSGKAWEYIGILKHLNRISRNRAYSETTVFPDRALTADNLVYKAKLAIALGIPNIMVMSGLCVIEEDYWTVWTEALDDMKQMDQQIYTTERSYPVHLLYGRHGVYQEPLRPSPLPVMSGLPVKPVRDDESEGAGEILCVFGDYRLDNDWERQLPAYKHIIFDLTAAKRNPDKINHPDYPHVVVWQHEAGKAAAQEEAIMLRKIIAECEPDYPYIIDGGLVGLIWLKEIGKVVLFNLEQTKSDSIIAFKGNQFHVTVQPYSFRIAELPWQQSAGGIKND